MAPAALSGKLDVRAGGHVLRRLDRVGGIVAGCIHLICVHEISEVRWNHELHLAMPAVRFSVQQVHIVS